MLAAPEPTAYDLRFRALGVPVRVHPTFWVTMLLLGGALNLGVGNADIWPMLVCTGVGFVSILVHEFGHALAYRAFGQWPRVVLYYLGGLAIGTAEERRPERRLAIILAGPGAGLLLLLLTLVVGMVFFGLSFQDLPTLCASILGLRWGDVFSVILRIPGGRIPSLIFLDLIEVNLLWTLLNLLPVFPLDGGQAAGVLLSMHDRHRGQVRLHVLSMITAGLMV